MILNKKYSYYDFFILLLCMYIVQYVLPVVLVRSDMFLSRAEHGVELTHGAHFRLAGDAQGVTAPIPTTVTLHTTPAQALTHHAAID